MTGYIKDHRKELDSDIWLMPPLYHRTWQWLKYNVNHTDNEIPMRDGSKMMIKRGQRLTSVRDIAKGISWYEGRKPKEPNPKTISAILEWMEKTSMIFIERGKGNREYTLITLINYDIYNALESQGNSKVTPDGEGGKQSADINNNDKNYKELFSTGSNSEKNVFGVYESEIDELSEYIKEELMYLELEYSEEWVKQAIKTAVIQGIKKMSYIKGTLKKWKLLDVPDPWTKERPPDNVTPFPKGGTPNAESIRQGSSAYYDQPVTGKNGVQPSKWAGVVAEMS